MGLFNKKKTDDEIKPTKQAKSDDKKITKTVTKTVIEDTSKKSKTPSKTGAEIKKVVSKKTDNKLAKNAYRVLVKPIISEKTTMGAGLNKYVFEVMANTNKVEIKQAISEAYGVVPLSVNIIKSRGKFVRRGRQTGRTKNIKKAIVTLKKGDSIKLYEGI